MSRDRAARRMRRNVAGPLLAGCLALSGCGTSVVEAPIQSYAVGESDDRIVLSVSVGWGQEEVKGVRVEETDAMVSIVVEVPAQRGEVPAIALVLEVPIALDAPLGSRTVMDGSRNEQVPRTL